MKHAARWALAGVLVSVAVALGAWQTRSMGEDGATARFDDLAAAHRIPPQYQPMGAEPEPLPTFFEMGDPRVNQLIVRDVSRTAEGPGWRWTREKPALRLPLNSANATPPDFAMDFTIVDTVFRGTGPVTLSISINGHLLGTVPCDHPGDFHFEKAVPAEWLAGANSATVEAALSKLWTVPSDGSKLGYILTREGFLPHKDLRN
jgi:hypothetical protein